MSVRTAFIYLQVTDTWWRLTYRRVLLLMKQKSGTKQILAWAQLLNNFIKNSGPFPTSRMPGFTFVFIALQLQDGCSRVQISLSYSRPEGELRCQPFMKKAEPFQNSP